MLHKKRNDKNPKVNEDQKYSCDLSIFTLNTIIDFKNITHSFFSYSTRSTLLLESKCFVSYFWTEPVTFEFILFKTMGSTIRPLKRPNKTIPRYILK